MPRPPLEIEKLIPAKAAEFTRRFARGEILFGGRDGQAFQEALVELLRDVTSQVIDEIERSGKR